MEFNATFIITAISFIVFVFLMNIILYRPLENIVEERKKLIENNYDDAKNADLKAKSLLEQKADKIAKTKVEAKNYIDTKLKEGYDGSTEVIKNARTKSIEFLQNQKENLLNQKNEIEANFDISKLAGLIKDKVLGAEVHCD